MLKNKSKKLEKKADKTTLKYFGNILASICTYDHKSNSSEVLRYLDLYFKMDASLNIGQITDNTLMQRCYCYLAHSGELIDLNFFTRALDMAGVVYEKLETKDIYKGNEELSASTVAYRVDCLMSKKAFMGEDYTLDDDFNKTKLKSL